jgi:flagellar hook assembly protein FlgD
VTDSPTITATPTATASYTPDAPYRAKIEVYNSAGELVATIAQDLACYVQPDGMQAVKQAFLPDSEDQGTFLLVGPNLVEGWDGKNTNGQMVSSGAYVVQAQVTDPFGKVKVMSTTLTVVRQDREVKVEVYNSAGELVKHFDQPVSGTGSSTGISLDKTHLTEGQSLNINYGLGSIPWDGRNDSGQMVQSGEYLVKVTRSTGMGQTEVFSQSVTVVNGVSNSLSTALVAPNPAQLSDGKVSIYLDLSLSGPIQVQAFIYDLAGELLAQFSNQGHPNSLEWKLTGHEASGIYLVRLEAKDGMGLKTSKTLRLALE